MMHLQPEVARCGAHGCGIIARERTGWFWDEWTATQLRDKRSITGNNERIVVPGRGYSEHK